jgi:hypothetical protein
LELQVKVVQERLGQSRSALLRHVISISQNEGCLPGVAATACRVIATLAETSPDSSGVLFDVSTIWNKL